MKTKPVDLRSCKPGDKLLLRDGTFAVYECRNTGPCGHIYPHRIGIASFNHNFTCTNDGYTYGNGVSDSRDVVKIIRQRTTVKKQKMSRPVTPKINDKLAQPAKKIKSLETQLRKQGQQIRLLNCLVWSIAKLLVENK